MFSAASHSFSFIFCGFPFSAPTHEKGPKTDQKGNQNEPRLLPNRSPKGASFLDEFSGGFWCQKGAQKGSGMDPLGRHFGVLFWMFFGCEKSQHKSNAGTSGGLQWDFCGTSRGALSWPWAPGGGLMVKVPSE